MTEEKLIETLTSKYVMTVEDDLYIYWEDAVAMLHEALAAQRKGCAEALVKEQMKPILNYPPPRDVVEEIFKNDIIAILNAEPDCTDSVPE
jgi:hypothetical protein